MQAISSDQNQMYHVETFQNLTSALASSVVDVCRAGKFESTHVTPKGPHVYDLMYYS